MEHYLKDFTNIYNKQIFLHNNIKDNNIRLVYGEYKKLYIIDCNDIDQTLHINYHMIPRTPYIDNIHYFSWYNHHIAVYPYLDYISQENMLDENIIEIKRKNYFINDGYKHASVIVKINKSKDNYYISYYINNKIIKNVEECRKDKNVSLFKNLIYTNAKENYKVQLLIVLEL